MIPLSPRMEIHVEEIRARLIRSVAAEAERVAARLATVEARMALRPRPHPYRMDTDEWHVWMTKGWPKMKEIAR